MWGKLSQVLESLVFLPSFSNASGVNRYDYITSVRSPSLRLFDILAKIIRTEGSVARTNEHRVIEGVRGRCP